MKCKFSITQGGLILSNMYRKLERANQPGIEFDTCWAMLELVPWPVLSRWRGSLAIDDKMLSLPRQRGQDEERVEDDNLKECLVRLWTARQIVREKIDREPAGRSANGPSRCSASWSRSAVDMGYPL